MIWEGGYPILGQWAVANSTCIGIARRPTSHAARLSDCDGSDWETNLGEYKLEGWQIGGAISYKWPFSETKKRGKYLCDPIGEKKANT